VWLVRDKEEGLLQIEGGGERQRRDPEKWDPKLHSPITEGQIIRVSIDSWNPDKKPATGEDFAFDFMDAAGNIVLRWSLNLELNDAETALDIPKCNVTCNSYDSSIVPDPLRPDERGSWGREEETSFQNSPGTPGAPKEFLESTKPRAGYPAIDFEMKADLWEISAVRFDDASGEETRDFICNFRHRSVLGNLKDVPARERSFVSSNQKRPPCVAVKLSDNCEGAMIETIMYEDMAKDHMAEAFKENKTMRLKLEFWSHDTGTGLDALDKDEQASTMAGSFLASAASFFGTSPKAADTPKSALALENFDNPGQDEATGPEATSPGDNP
jgi:hypothetical protein